MTDDDLTHDDDTYGAGDLFPALRSSSGRPALRFGDRSLTYGELADAAGELAVRIGGASRVALWATPTLETAVGVVAALLAGVPVVPLNPKTGERELGHILADSAPRLVLAGPGDELPAPLAAHERVDIPVTGVGGPPGGGGGAAPPPPGGGPPGGGDTIPPPPTPP
ncbi:AMP-binding protein, partial [Streptomyces sp. NPDC058953]|uniref:AMP-binding protein n=1 Tax=Streptomyces sp. NPDC058953 TaxID=3346676 RepID=UPI0036A6722D